MKHILIGGGVVLALLAAAFAYYAFSPLLFDREVNDALPSETEMEDDAATPPTDVDSATEPVATPDDTQQPVATTPAVPRGPFSIDGTGGHPASGSVRIVETADGEIVRFENYDGTNGPDLYVYLTNDLEAASDYVSLGRSKGNQGNANYEVPASVNVADYQYVVTWCQRFGVLFDYADITAS